MSIVKLNNRGVRSATTFGSITGLGSMILIKKQTASSSSTISFVDGTNEYNYHSFIAGYCNTTSAVDAVQFSINSGTHDGTFKLYGIKDS